jgi:Icc-related predicted phosphoesterase
MVRLSRMSFLFVSDLHYSLKQFDWVLAQAGDFEMVVIGGDLLDMGSDLDTDVQIAIVEKYLDLLRKKTTVVVCSGNHDGDAVSEANESFAEWLREARNDRLHVDGDSFDLGETRVTVCPWWNGEVMRAEVEAQLTVEATRVRGKWIWVYHAPPEGARTSWAGRRFIGDDFLKAMIERFKPDMVLSGHIHNSPFYEQGAWVDRLGSTWVFNPGRQIGMQPTSIVVDLEAMTARWSSIEAESVQDLRVAEA